jgi:hypothetical protein
MSILGEEESFETFDICFVLGYETDTSTASTGKRGTMRACANRIPVAQVSYDPIASSQGPERMATQISR